jgi:hypothetical protein
MTSRFRTASHLALISVTLLVTTSALAAARVPSSSQDFSYVGPAGAVSGSVASVKIDGDPTGTGLGGVQALVPAGALRIRVTDVSGRPVAVQVTAFVDGDAGFTFVQCDGRDFVTPRLTGKAKLYVTPLVGLCSDPAHSVASAPTRGSVGLVSS